MPSLQQVADLYGPDQILVLAVNFKECSACCVGASSYQNNSIALALLQRQAELAFELPWLSGQWVGKGD